MHNTCSNLVSSIVQSFLEAAETYLQKISYISCALCVHWQLYNKMKSCLANINWLIQYFLYYTRDVRCIYIHRDCVSFPALFVILGRSGIGKILCSCAPIITERIDELLIPFGILNSKAAASVTFMMHCDSCCIQRSVAAIWLYVRSC